MDRRLAAILATDVVGYARLIRADEEGTIAALKALRADLVAPKLSEHNGRIVKLMGDGMLAEFPSVVSAVRAAVEIQSAMARHNSELPEGRRIAFRPFSTTLPGAAGRYGSKPPGACGLSAKTFASCPRGTTWIIRRRQPFCGLILRRLAEPGKQLPVVASPRCAGSTCLHLHSPMIR